jgi:hypothetical protein
MGILAKGVNKKIAYRKESAWGTIAADGVAAKQLRRVTSQFNQTAETLQSAEIRQDYQIADYRLGSLSTEGSLNGELSPGTYSDFFAAALAKDFVAGGTTTGASLTIATSGSFYTITRAAGSWLTDGFYVGNVIRLSGAGFAPANVGKNIQILSITALVLTVRTFDANTLTPEGPIAAAGAAVVGKQTFAPLTGHTSDSFTVEEFYGGGVNVSEVHAGNKVGSIAVQLPASGFCTVDVSFMGKGMMKTGNTQHFATATAASTSGLTVGISGSVLVNSVPAGVITNASFTLDRGLEAAVVVGSKYAADIFDGRVNVTGDFSTYLENPVYRDYFINETKISLVFALTTGSEANAEVISFVLPSVKLGSATRNDGEAGIVQDHSFQALLNSVTTGGLPATTLLVQDTSVL